jgi:hypothetical protein
MLRAAVYRHAEGMKRQSVTSNDLPALRLMVWLSLVGATVLFWAVVAGVVITLLR